MIKSKSKNKAKETKDSSVKGKTHHAQKVASKKKEHDVKPTKSAPTAKKKVEAKKAAPVTASALKKGAVGKKNQKPLKVTKESETKLGAHAQGKKAGDLKKTSKPEFKKTKVKAKEVAKAKEDLEVSAKAKVAESKKSAKAEVAESKKSAKAEGSVKSRKDKAPKTEAPEEELLEDTEDFGTDELSEYESELESAEEETEEEATWTEEQPVAAAVATPNKEASEEVVLTDAEGRRYCRVRDCDQIAAVDTYCRYHYLLLWKKIQVRKKILADGKLERYVEELTSRYPDKFLEVIRRDLRTEKDFLAAIQELEIDESAVDNDYEDESSNFIDEVRGASNESISDEEEF